MRNKTVTRLQATAQRGAVGLLSVAARRRYSWPPHSRGGRDGGPSARPSPFHSHTHTNRTVPHTLTRLAHSDRSLQQLAARTARGLAHRQTDRQTHATGGGVRVCVCQQLGRGETWNVRGSRGQWTGDTATQTEATAAAATATTCPPGAPPRRPSCPSSCARTRNATHSSYLGRKPARSVSTAEMKC